MKPTLYVLSGLMALSFAAAPLPVKADHEEEKQGNQRISKDRFSQTADFHRADTLLGAAVRYADGNERAGNIEDVVVDLESGRILYLLISGERGGSAPMSRWLAAPPQAFSSEAQGKGLRLKGDRQTLRGAPVFSDTEKEPGRVSFVSQVYDHFNEKTWWNGDGGRHATFGNAHRLSQLMKMEVQNVQNETMGRIASLVLHVPEGRILYVVLDPDRSLKLGNQHYALPPNLFTASRSNDDLLVINADREKLSKGPHFQRGQWPSFSDYEFASDVYDHYGKRAYFEGRDTVAPTSDDRDEPPRRRGRD